jgi:sugar (pentulose or hexulose) kinase
MLDIMTQQLISTEVLHNYPVKRVFVDGGFSKNPIFMNLLAAAFPELEVFAASMAQASSLGLRWLFINIGTQKHYPEI